MAAWTVNLPCDMQSAYSSVFLSNAAAYEERLSCCSVAIADSCLDQYAFLPSDIAKEGNQQ